MASNYDVYSPPSIRLLVLTQGICIYFSDHWGTGVLRFRKSVRQTHISYVCLCLIACHSLRPPYIQSP
jgi:hypothetical protein